jgi:hypothetical protein
VAGKIRKLAAVIFLTITIWVWAFLSLEKDTTLFGSIELSPAADPDYYVTFNDDKSRVGVKMTFRGSPTRIASLERRHRAADSDPTRERLDFYYDPAEHAQTETNTYRIDVMELAKEAIKTRDIALTVVGCDPLFIEAHVQKLTLREVSIEVRDEAGAEVKAESVEPARVMMYLREGEPAAARIVLSGQQIENARSRPVRERPFIVIGPGDKKQYAAQTVLVRLPSTMPLEAQVFQTNPGRIGFILPPELIGVYRVELIDDIKTINFRSTQEAKTLYQQQPYHLLIQVLSGDQNLEQTPPRTVIYNFPPEMVRKGLIQAPDPPSQVRIRLIPISPPPAPAP